MFVKTIVVSRTAAILSHRRKSQMNEHAHCTADPGGQEASLSVRLLVCLCTLQGIARSMSVAAKWRLHPPCSQYYLTFNTLSIL